MTPVALNSAEPILYKGNKSALRRVGRQLGGKYTFEFCAALLYTWRQPRSDYRIELTFVTRRKRDACVVMLGVHDCPLGQ